MWKQFENKNCIKKKNNIGLDELTYSESKERFY